MTLELYLPLVFRPGLRGTAAVLVGHPRTVSYSTVPVSFISASDGGSWRRSVTH